MSRARGVLHSREFFAEFGAWGKATQDQRRLWAHLATVGREVASSNRKLIGRHPDLAEKVVAMGLVSRIDQWTGYVPPSIAHYADNGGTTKNWSPYRLELIELIEEARRREAA